MFWENAYAGTISLPQASTLAPKIDALHDFLFWLGVISLGLVTIVMLYFVKKYHRSNKGRQTAYILDNHLLETIWTVIPLIFMLVVFAWGYKDYLWLRMEPQNPVEINVVARQWMWTFEYPNGRKTMNEIYMPKGKAVKLIMTSEDVIHDFFLPHMRIKQDVVPGMYTYVSFEPTLVGLHPVYCAEFCGTGHSDMLAKAYVLEPQDYDNWLETGKVSGVSKTVLESQGAATAGSAGPSNGPVKSMAEKGKDLFASKGCFACHTTDGTRKIGPPLNGIFGTTVELESGSKVSVNENYIRESLMDPTAKIVKGYPPSMPTFKGLLSDEEINSLIAFIKGTK